MVEGIYIPNAKADTLQALLNLLSPSEGVFIPFSKLQLLTRDQFGNIRPSDWMTLSEWIQKSHRSRADSQKKKQKKKKNKLSKHAKKKRKIEIMKPVAAEGSHVHLFQSVLTTMSDLDGGGETLLTEATAVTLGLLCKGIEGVSISYWQQRAKKAVNEFNVYPLTNMIITPENAQRIVKWYRALKIGRMTCPMCQSTKKCSLVLRERLDNKKVFSRHLLVGSSRGRSIDRNDTQLDNLALCGAMDMGPTYKHRTIAAYCSKCSVRLFLAELIDWGVDNWEDVSIEDVPVFKCCGIVCSKKCKCDYCGAEKVLCERCVTGCSYCNGECCEDHKGQCCKED